LFDLESVVKAAVKKVARMAGVEASVAAATVLMSLVAMTTTVATATGTVL
jgi:hypothetical protein